VIRGLQDITANWLFATTVSMWGFTQVWYFVKTRTIPEWRRALRGHRAAR
jgi:hypothetical protein